MKTNAVRSTPRHSYLHHASCVLLYSLLAIVSFLAASKVAADIDSGLVGYWNMDAADISWGTNRIIDRSGHGNTGTLVGLSPTALISSGRYGQALQFSSAETYISIPQAQSLDMGISNRHTYAAWIKLSTLPTNWLPVIHKSTDQSLSLTSGGLVLFRSGGTVSQILVYGSPVTATDQWYHLAGTYDGARASLYINGVSCPSCSTPSIGVVGRNATLRIGGANSVALDGLIDEVRVYNRALSAQEILALYQATSFDTAPLPVPTMPVNFSAASHSRDSISLTWTANTEASVESYRLYQNNALVAVIDRGQNSYQVKNLEPGLPYAFHLSAMSNKQMESEKTPELTVTTDGSAVPIQPVPLPSNYIIPQIRISAPEGALSPDASGVYSRELGASCNNLPVWKRNDGAFYFQYLNQSFMFITQAPVVCDWNKRKWEWIYSSFDAPSTGIQNGASGIALLTKEPDPDYPTPGQYLNGRPRPVFKAGHSLPPLTKFSWPYSYEMTEAMAHWGYALDLGDSDDALVSSLDKLYSRTNRLISLVKKYPTQYKLGVNLHRIQDSLQPDAAYIHDASGALVTPRTWSPEAPESILAAMGSTTQSNLQKIAERAPISVVLNGGERGLGVLGWDGQYWKQDPVVLAAKGDSPWADYISQRKAHQEQFFTNAANAAGNPLYIFYTAGGNAHGAGNWDWDYRWMHPISDLPSNEAYSSYGNLTLILTGKTASPGYDLLTYALNAFGYAATFGKTLSYNWVCAGWSLDPASANNTAIDRYMGFLKSYYTAGMIGGNAGYYSYPAEGFNAQFMKGQPPHWVRQIEALSQVHAEFGYLEDMLRSGELLSGPQGHIVTPSRPAYEFYSGYFDTRVLARKLTGRKRWLISAWAADGVTRPVDVTIPELGVIHVTASPAGALYDVRIVNGARILTMLDDGSLAPTPLVIPSANPDLDGAAPRAPFNFRIAG